MHSLSTRASTYSNFLPTLLRRFRIFSMRVNLNRVSTVGMRGGRYIYAYAFFPSRPWIVSNENDSTIDCLSIYFIRSVKPRCCRVRSLPLLNMRPLRNGHDRESPWQFFPTRCEPARAPIVTARLFVIRDKESRCNVCTTLCWQIRMAN